MKKLFLILLVFFCFLGSLLVAKSNDISSVNTASKRTALAIDISAFITTWQTTVDGESITIPTQGGGYNYSVDWGDGTSENALTGNAVHTYATAGTYTVKINDTFPRIYFNSTLSASKILTIEQWGFIQWTNMYAAFRGCDNLTYNATDAPDLSAVTDFRFMFEYARSFNGDLSTWNVSSATDMSNMFSEATAFNGNISTWNVSNVIDMNNMFSGAAAFNGDLSTWVVSSVADMNSMFYNAAAFNQNIGAWNISSVTDMNYMFSGAAIFNQNLSSWNVSSVIDMNNMFSDATAFNGSLSGWNVSSVTNMNSMFYYATAFNQVISAWNVSSVTDMNGMFDSASAFDGDLSTWDVSSVTDMGAMFYGTAFNQNISSWGVSSVTDMSYMFTSLASFNQDISSWDVTNVTDMQYMLAGATVFNQDLSTWDVSGVTNMSGMFNEAGVSQSNYESTLVGWVALANTPSNISLGATNITYCSQEATRNTLINTYGWNITGDTKVCPLEIASFQPADETLNLAVDANLVVTFNGAIKAGAGTVTVRKTADNSVVFSGSPLTDNSRFTISDTDLIIRISAYNGSPLEPLTAYHVTLDANAVANMLDQNLTSGITDNTTWNFTTAEFLPFITTWQTTVDGEYVTIPTLNGSYDYTVDWGDGSLDTNQTGNAIHIYTTAGTYTVKISGTFPQIYFDDTTNPSKILSIEQWGSIAWTSMQRAFRGCSNLISNATDAPNITAVSDMSFMFYDAASFDGDLSTWDVSKVADMSYMFYNAAAFNQDISFWDVSSVTNMGAMFYNAAAFNQDLSSWDVSSVTNMGSMFYMTPFNQDLSTWDVSSVNNMSGMFSNTPFNQDLSTWDVSSVTSMSGMFRSTPFNQDLSTWDVSSVTNMSYMFSNATAFNQNLSAWDVSSVTNMRGMFNYAYSFNGDLSTWDVSSVTNMRYMFWEAGTFNQDLSAWDVSSVTNMNLMFYKASNFDQDVSNWDISSVTVMDGMLSYSGLSQSNYESALTNWAALPSVKPNVTIGVTGLYYCSEVAKNSLISNQNWVIQGDIKECPPEIVSYFPADESSSITIQLDLIVTFDEPIVAGAGVVTVRKTADNSVVFSGSPLSNNTLFTITDQSMVVHLMEYNSNPLEEATAYHVTMESNAIADSLGKSLAIGIIDNTTWNFTTLDQNSYFITTWRTTTDNESITIPTTGTGYSYAVDWGDGTSDHGLQSDATHSYLLAGDYTVKVSGVFPRIYFYYRPDRSKIIAIDQWGDNQWTNMKSAFQGCNNLTNNATDVPNLTGVTDLSSMFYNATAFNGDLSAWDVSSVTNMSYVFNNATAFNGDLSTWDVSSVIDMSSMFGRAPSFNQDLSTWDVSSVTIMRDMFQSATSFNGDISAWDVSSVTDMSYMFANYNSNNALVFNQDLSAWDVSSVTNMRGMFANYNNINASVFNQDLSTWDVSSVTDMTGMFYNAAVFNQDLSTWDVSSVTNIGGMFSNAYSFNSDLSTWDVSSVTDMNGMFYNATAFNQDLSTWNVGLVTDMTNTFNNATAFNQDLSTWNVSNVTTMADMLSNSGLSQTNYEGIFPGWLNASNTPSNIVLGATNLYYCEEGDVSRTILINTYGWTISGDVKECPPEVTTFSPQDEAQKAVVNTDLIVTFNEPIVAGAGVVTVRKTADNTVVFTGSPLSDNTLFTITDQSLVVHLMEYNGNPLEEATAYHVTMESNAVADSLGKSLAIGIIDNTTWNFTTLDQNSYFITTWRTTTDNESITIPTTGTGYSYSVDWGDGTSDRGLQSDATHSYLLAGDYSVKISGVFPRIYFNYSSDRLKIIAIDIWGSNEWISMNLAFAGCTNLINNATDTPNLAGVTDLSDMFSGASSFNGDLSTWNVSSVTNMSFMFYSAKSFNGDLSTWDVSSVTSMSYMFRSAAAFNQNIGAWDVSSVTSMSYMFGDPVTNANAFNGDLSNWDVSSVTSMSNMFNGAASFNGDISTWDVSSVTNMSFMFGNYYTSNASAFNGDLSAWDVSSVTNMRYMFSYVDAFNGDLSTWDVSSVTSMSYMFSNADAFNGDLSTWDVSSVTDMQYMFSNADAFNSDLSAWDVSSVTDMSDMFYAARSFNGDLSAWDVSSVTDMQYMFRGAASFNGDLSAWDVQAVTDMTDMLSYSGMSVANYDNTLIGWQALPALQSYVQLGASGISYCQSEAARNSLRSSNIWTLTGDTRDCPPEIVSYLPVDGAVNMALTSDLVITFNDDIQAGAGVVEVKKVTDNTVVLTGNPLADNELFSISGNQLIIHLQAANGAAPVGNETYYVTVAPDAVADLVDQNLLVGVADNTTWNFTTASASSTFITTWQTTADNESIVIPTYGDFYTVDWGDGSVDNGLSGNTTHTYTTAGTYTVTIAGVLSSIAFNNTGDKDKIMTIEQWGSNQWTYMYYAFYGCSNLVSNATDVPDLSRVTNLSKMFSDATSFNGDLSAWDVSNMTNMSGMFSGARLFNGDLSAWDVSNVKYMVEMFNKASAFDHSLGSWDISNVIDMSNMLDVSGLSRSNYESTLIGWLAVANTPTFIDFGASGLKYCNEVATRNTLVNTYGWNISNDRNVCPLQIVSYAPVDESIDVAIDANLIVTFDLDIKAGPGIVAVKKVSDNTVVLSGTPLTDGGIFSISGNQLMIALSAYNGEAVLPNESYYVNIAADAIYSLVNEPLIAGVDDNTTWNFTTAKLDQTITIPTISNVLTTDAPFDVAATTTSSLALTYAVTGPASITGSTITLDGAGTVVLTVTQAGNNTYNAASATATFEVLKADQTITIPTISDAFTTDAPFDVAATTTSSLDLTYAVTGPASIAGTTITLDGAGTVVLTVTQAGDNTYNAASATTSFEVLKADQTITITAIDDQLTTSAPIQVVASVDTGLDLTYSVTGQATISGNEITLNKFAGTVVVSVSQAGNSMYNAITSTVSFKVSKADAAIKIVQVENKLTTDYSIDIEAWVESQGIQATTAVPALTITGPATLVNSKLYFDGVAGTVVVRGIFNGNYIYNAATPVSMSFNVSKADQVITITPIDDTFTTTSSVSVVASVNTGAELLYFVDGPATISGTTITLNGAGTVNVTVTQVGNQTYNEATASTSFEVTKVNQIIDITTIANKITTDAAFDVVATNDSGLALSYSVTGPASIVGTLITLDGTAGTVVVTASHDGDATFNSASATSSFDVVKADQVVTLDAIANKITTDAAFEVSATVGTGLDLTYAVTGPAAIDGTTITLDGTAGTVTVSATQAGNDTYNDATASTSFEVAKADQVLTVTAIEDKDITDAAFDVVASVDTGLDLTYTIEGPATISGATITLDGTIGTVTVTVTQLGNDTYNGVEEMVSFEVSETVLAIDDLNLIVNVYPNPATDWIELSGLDDGAEIQIIDLAGHVLLRQQYRKTSQISTQQLGNGIYLLNVYQNQSVKSFRFQILR